MDRVLTEFIRKNKNTDRELHYTHVSCVRPKGRYGFGRKEMEEFWNVYCQRLIENPEVVSGMAEIPQEYSMLVVDGDIKKKIVDVLQDHPEIKTSYLDGEETKHKYTPIRLYNYKHIKNTISAYQAVIKSGTKDWKPEHSVCILLEKDPYVCDDYIKSGFHLAFINYFCSRSSQDTYLLPRVVSAVNESNIFKDIGYSVSSSVLDITKKNTGSKPWLLYGSRKSETSDVYHVSKAYDCDANEIPLDTAFENYKLYDGFEKEIKMEDFEYYYPRIFSINPCFRKCVEIIPVFDASTNIQFNDRKQKDNDDVKYDETYAQKMETAEELVKMLDEKRADDRDNWIEIGWIIHNISEGSKDGFELWNTFSQQCPEKYSYIRCGDEWGHMKNEKSFTLGSLKYYAKLDSPEEYAEFCRARLDKMVSRAINGFHNDLAKALYESYSTEYVCASLKPEKWYQFANHHWEPMEEGVELRKKISDDLVHRYSALIKDSFDTLRDTHDDDVEKKKEIESRIGNIYKLIKNLKCNTFKNSVMKECKEVFYDKEFLKKLGKDKYLIALKNGVYDLKNFVFRDGKPEDYLAYQMPIFYHEFNDFDERVIETNSFFEKIFPDSKIRDYFIDRLAELLTGGNKRKHLYFWTGRGNNGKSILKLLIQKMFGPYFIDIPNSVLVGQKPKSGQACPELARSDKGVRVAFTQEPNKKDLVNTGAAKEYSGNDSFYNRGLYENGSEIETMFKLIMICNDLPGVTTNDPAFWARARVIPFESTFTDSPPEDEDEQFRTKTFLKDENFDEKIEEMMEALFWILVKRVPMIERIISEPAKVLEATLKYRRSQDVHAQYIDERIIDDEKKSISLSDYYTSFKEWFRHSFAGSAIPHRNDCHDYLLDIWGPLKNSRWEGKRLRSERDDVQDGKAEEVASTDWSKKVASNNPLMAQ